MALAKQTSAFRRRWRRERERNESWSTLTVYKLTCLYFPEPHGGHITLPPKLEPTNPALSSHWSFPSHPTLPLFINPSFSSPSLASLGWSSHLPDQRLALVRPKALKYISATNNFQVRSCPHIFLCHSKEIQGRGLQAFHRKCQKAIF